MIEFWILGGAYVWITSMLLIAATVALLALVVWWAATDQKRWPDR